MPTDTLPIESPMLPPLVLRPPLGPRVLRGLVLALAAIFHVVTAGWSLIANGREGDIAGAARTLLREQSWLPLHTDSPAGPLAVWLAKGSMNLFGVNEFGARLPTALAVVAAVWFTIRLGERFGGMWRGFVAGMLLLCTPGMFTLARTLTPAPLQAALLAATFYCLVRGFDDRRGRRQWFLLAWIGFALGYFAGGWISVAIPAGTVLVLSAIYREARMRFARLLNWEGGVVFAISAAVAALCGCSGASSAVPGLASWQIAWWQIWLFFPWSVLLIPGAYAMAVRLIERRGLDWAEAFPLVWFGVGLAAILLSPTGSLFDSVMIWPAAALWCALRLEITPRVRLLRVIAIVLGLSLAALLFTSRLKSVLIWIFPGIADFIGGIPDYFWPSVTSTVFISVLAFALFAGAAFWLELQHHRRFAVVALFGALIPAGYAFADASAKFAPYFSYADMAHSIDGTPRAKREVAVDGSRFFASSLRFYLSPPFEPFELPLEPSDSPDSPNFLARRADALAFWGGQSPAFLITRRTRVPAWEALLGPRVSVVCQSGGSLLLTNGSGNPPP